MGDLRHVDENDAAVGEAGAQRVEGRAVARLRLPAARVGQAAVAISSGSST